MAASGPWRETGQRWFVHRSGSDSAPGLDRIRPLATTAQAVTNAAAGDTIVYLENHQETLAAAQVLSKTLYLVGEGSGATRPQFICNGAVAMFDITSAGVWLENLYFPQSLVAPTARVRVAAAECAIVACDFDCGGLDTAPAVKLITGAAQFRAENCRWLSTATVITAQPSIGLEVANATSGVWLTNCTFDGGVCGWSDYVLKGTAAVTRLYAVNISLLRGCDVFTATGTTGRILVRDRSGTARLVLTA
jgi:hypothetical protein